MARISIGQDEYYDCYFRPNPEGLYDVPEKDLERWQSVVEAYAGVQNEMRDLMAARDVELQEAEDLKVAQAQADLNAKADAVVQEVFGNIEDAFDAMGAEIERHPIGGHNDGRGRGAP
jgi:hypothetical protein